MHLSNKVSQREGMNGLTGVCLMHLRNKVEPRLHVSVHWHASCVPPI